MQTALKDHLACPDCDLLLRRHELQVGENASCPRCGGVVERRTHDALDRSLAYLLASAVCIAIANLYPFMTFSLHGRVENNTMLTGVMRLFEDGYHPLAILIFSASIGIPLLKIVMGGYVLLPLKLGRQAWEAARVLRYWEVLRPWGMLEVYMLGVLVAITKLAGMATILVGTAFYAFVALIIFTTLSQTSLDSHALWERLEPES
jgi:paraquat-inducible protein A